MTDKRLSSPSKRMISARENASYGGQARAQRFFNRPEMLKEWSSRGGKAVLEKYGREYFVELRRLRKHYPKYKNSEPATRPNWRREAAIENGRLGGIRRAELLSPECLKAMAREGGLATLERYGNEHFKEIRKKRRYYKKGYITARTKARVHREALQNAKETPGPLRYLWLAVANNFSS